MVSLLSKPRKSCLPIALESTSFLPETNDACSANLPCGEDIFSFESANNSANLFAVL
jgi:hypothetical protein